MENGGLILGFNAEKIVNHYHFYAVFKDQEEYVVRSEQGEIGRITNSPPIGSRIGLAGRAWEIKEINPRQRIIWVKLVQGYATVYPAGGGVPLHPKIVQRIRQVLFEKTIYRYLQPQAQQRLSDARQMAQQHGMDKSNIIALGGGSFCVFPWTGSLAFSALRHKSRAAEHKSYKIELPNSPFYFTMSSANGVEGIRKNIESLCATSATIPVDKVALLNKYDEYIPKDLLVSSYLQDEMDVETMQKALMSI